MYSTTKCISVVPSAEMVLEHVDAVSPASLPSSEVANSSCMNMGTSVDDSLGHLLTQLQADMNGLLQKHLNDLQRDWEQGLGKHVKIIQHTLQHHLLQEHQHPKHQQQHAQSSEFQDATQRACSKIVPIHPALSSALIDLPTSTLHVAMLEASISLGKAESEESALGSGFMGGGGVVMRVLWGMLGITLLAFGINVDESHFGADGAARVATHSLSSLGLLTSGIGFCVRSYFLHVRQSRQAYHALTMSLLCFAINIIALRMFSICMTWANGCSWRTASYLFKVDGASCVPMSSIYETLWLVNAISLLRIAQLLYYMRRDDAANLLIYVFAFDLPLLLFTLIYNVAMGLTNAPMAMSDGAFAILVAITLPFLLHKRRSTRRRAWLRVETDADAYAEQWVDVANSSGKVVSDIADLVCQVNQGIRACAADAGVIKGKPTASISNSKDDVSTFMGVERCRAENMQQVLLAATSDAGKSDGVYQLFLSLPLLYAQAFALNEHFQDKCAGWAAGIGDHKPVSVKKQNRAIQKLWRTYRGNPRLLTDLVRSSIVCDTLSDTLMVLRCVHADPTVAILRVKNRFDPKYDSSLSGGYRNLALNLIVVDEHTSQACTASHICELQLALRAFDDLKTDGGHKRFVEFRDMRAE